MSLRFIVIALACACLGGGAIWFFSHFERTTEKEWTGYQGKARQDQWLAAERLLQRMGGNATAVHALPELGTLPRSATLLLPDGRQALSAQLRDRILAWVRRGGRLIIAAEFPNQRDTLLDALGVQRKQMKWIPSQKNDEDGESEGFRMQVSIALPPEQPPVTVLMKRVVDLTARNPLAKFGKNGITAAVLLAHGEGRVLVLNELSMFSNPAIGKEDHAEFLWRMVQVDGARASAYFFTDPHKLSLVQWFRENAWAVVAGGALFLLAWLWRAVPRFGPVVPDPDRSRRRLLDHLRASGRFLWKHGGSRRLAEAAREACLRRILRTHPELLGVPEADREARMAEVVGLDAEQSRLLFTREAPARALDFIRTIQVYQTVHESLARKRAGGRRRTTR